MPLFVFIYPSIVDVKLIWPNTMKSTSQRTIFRIPLFPVADENLHIPTWAILQLSWLQKSWSHDLHNLEVVSGLFRHLVSQHVTCGAEASIWFEGTQSFLYTFSWIKSMQKLRIYTLLGSCMSSLPFHRSFASLDTKLTFLVRPLRHLDLNPKDLMPFRIIWSIKLRAYNLRLLHSCISEHMPGISSSLNMLLYYAMRWPHGLIIVI